MENGDRESSPETDSSDENDSIAANLKSNEAQSVDQIKEVDFEVSHKSNQENSENPDCEEGEECKDGNDEVQDDEGESEEVKKLKERVEAEQENEGNCSLLSRLEIEGVEEASKEDEEKLKLIQNGVQTEPNKVRKRVRIKLPATDDEEDSEDQIEVDTIVESGEVCYLFEESKFDSEPDLTKIPAPKRVRVLRIKERKQPKPQIIFYPRPEVPEKEKIAAEEEVDHDSVQEKKEDEEAERAKIEKLKKRLEKRRSRRRMFRDRKRYWIKMICKAVQIFMIGVSVVSVPVDLWKLVDGVIKSQNALDSPTALEYLEFYSATIGTHIIGGAGAIESEAFLTVASRLASTWLYQVDQSSKNSSEGPPSDPKQIQKWIKEKVPRHRLPKGYKFPKEDENVQTNTMEDDMMGGMGGMGYPGMGGMGVDGMYPGIDGLGGIPGGRRSKGSKSKTGKKKAAKTTKTKKSGKKVKKKRSGEGANDKGSKKKKNPKSSEPKRKP